LVCHLAGGSPYGSLLTIQVGFIIYYKIYTIPNANHNIAQKFQIWKDYNIEYEYLQILSYMQSSFHISIFK
jgi:hypothetical protein